MSINVPELGHARSPGPEPMSVHPSGVHQAFSHWSNYDNRQRGTVVYALSGARELGGMEETVPLSTEPRWAHAGSTMVRPFISVDPPKR